MKGTVRIWHDRWKGSPGCSAEGCALNCRHQSIQTSCLSLNKPFSCAVSKPCRFLFNPVQMQNSLRSLRNSAAKKRAKLSGNISDLESPDSALKLDLSGESPSQASSPSAGFCSESGVYSQESLTSPLSTIPRRGRIT